MKKKKQPSRGGRSKNKVAMTASAADAKSSKNIHQKEVLEKFESLSLRGDDRTLSAKPNTMKWSDDVTYNKKQTKKLSRNSGGKKKGNNKNVLGAKQLNKAVVVEISEATVALSKNKKKNLNSEKELVAAAQDVENVSPNIQYGSYDGIYPEHYYHDLGYYYQDSGYYQYYDDYGYPLHDMSYHYQYVPLPMADQPPAMNIHAPAFEPTVQHR